MLLYVQWLSIIKISQWPDIVFFIQWKESDSKTKIVYVTDFHKN